MHEVRSSRGATAFILGGLVLALGAVAFVLAGGHIDTGRGHGAAASAVGPGAGLAESGTDIDHVGLSATATPRSDAADG